MTILIKCSKCNKEVDLKTLVLFGKNHHVSHPLIAAGRKCSNQHVPYPLIAAGRKCSAPNCNKIILIELIDNINTTDLQVIEDTKVDWNKIGIQNLVYFGESLYEVARITNKKIIGETFTDRRFPIIYLRSLTTNKDNLIAEVTSTGLLNLIQEENSSHHKTWTEEQLQSLIEKEVDYNDNFNSM